MREGEHDPNGPSKGRAIYGRNSFETFECGDGLMLHAHEAVTMLLQPEALFVDCKQLQGQMAELLAGLKGFSTIDHRMVDHSESKQIVLDAFQATVVLL